MPIGAPALGAFLYFWLKTRRHSNLLITGSSTLRGATASPQTKWNDILPLSFANNSSFWKRFPFWNGYNKLSGSMSTSTAVCGISLASQYAIAPLSSFVNTDRFGDLSKN